MNIPTTLSVFAALGLGFAAGKWLPVLPNGSHHSHNGESTDNKAVTFPQNGSTGAGDTGGKLSLTITSDTSGENLVDLVQSLKDTRNQLYNLDNSVSRQIANSRRTLMLDHVLADATEEELVALLTDDSVEKSDIMFKHLASRNPEIAAVLWLERARSKAEFTGVKGLLESWVEASPSAAETWVMGLPEGEIKTAAMQSLIPPLAKVDAGKAIDHLMTQEAEYQLSTLVGPIADNLTDAEFEAVADRFLQKRDQKWNHQAPLQMLVGIWMDRDPESTFAWLASRPPGVLSEHIVTNGMHRLANKPGQDHQAVLQQMTPYLDKLPSMATGAGTLWMQWLASGKDDAGAMRWLEENGESLRPSQYLRWGAMGQLNSSKIRRVFDLVEASPETPIRSALLEGFIYSLSQSSPQESLELILKTQPPGSKSSEMISSTIGFWAGMGEPEKAIQWSLDNMEPGNPRQQAVRYATSQWAENDPTAAARYLTKLPKKEREDALSGLANTWARRDPDGAVEFAQTLKEEDSDFARSVFYQFAETENVDTLLPRAQSLPGGKVRNEAVYGLFQGLARNDADKATKILDEMEATPLRDRAVYGFVRGIEYEDQRAAMAWALQLQRPGEKRGKLLSVGKRWLQNDKPAATKWIQNNTSIDPEIRTKLLNQVTN